MLLLIVKQTPSQLSSECKKYQPQFQRCLFPVANPPYSLSCFAHKKRQKRLLTQSTVRLPKVITHSSLHSVERKIYLKSKCRLKALKNRRKCRAFWRYTANMCMSDGEGESLVLALTFNAQEAFTFIILHPKEGFV